MPRMKKAQDRSRSKRSEPEKSKKKAKKFDDAAFYKKYGHVVPGSIKEVEVGIVVDGLTVVHPRICKIKCIESGKTRTVHVQDAWQVKYSEEVQARKAKERAAARRKAKRKE